jgi:hypothetical protein
LLHSGSPSARSFSRSPSPPPPSFTQYPSPPRSLVRDGQTSPLRPRLVVSRSTCPPLSPSPHANSFVMGTAVINTHAKFPAGTDFVGDQNVTLKERRGEPKFLNRIRTSVRFLLRWRRMAVCERNVLVAHTLS